MRATLLFLFVCAVPLCAGWEQEGLRSNPLHRTSRWYTAIHAANPNIDSVMAWLRHDAKVGQGAPSLEQHEAERWVREHLFAANADGTLQDAQDAGFRVLKVDAKYSSVVQASAEWKCVGPFTWDREAPRATGSEGIGVLRSVAVHPAHPDTLLVGTISAGAWWSGDAGKHWTPVTDDLTVQQTDHVAFAPSHPLIAFAATNVGLARSNDAGRTFRMTALDSRPMYPATQAVEHVAIDPADPNRVVVATDGKLRATADGGATWQDVPESQGRYWSVVMHPTNPNVLYTVSYSNNVSTFSVFAPQGRITATGLPKPEVNAVTPRALIAVSPAAPECVWVLYGGRRDTIGGVWGLYKSTDAGKTFTHLCCGAIDGPELPNSKNPNLFDYNVDGLGLGQITWDMAFAVSNTDTSLMVAAGIFPYMSRDGGRTWKATAPIHYDVQDACIVGNTAWIATDGGLQRTDDFGATMQDRSEGICAVEVWGFGQAPGTGVMTIGAYHLPIFIRDDAVYDGRSLPGGWYAWSGADAMMADVNPDNPLWLYAKPWSSVRARRSTNKAVLPALRELGIDLGYIPLSNVAFHPNKSYTLVAADHSIPGIVRTHDNGDNWEVLKKFTTSITHVRVAERRPTTMAVIADARVWRSDDDGSTWTDITPTPAQTFNRRAIDIAFEPDNPDTMWMAFGGGQTNVKVLRSSDAGSTWQDLSGALKTESVICLAVLRGSDEVLFAGTNRGVFVRSAADKDWAPFGAKLPTCQVNFLHIDAVDGILRAGTSRGIWELPLTIDRKPVAAIATSTDTLRCFDAEVVYTDRSAAQPAGTSWRQWSFPGGEPPTSTLRQPRVRYPWPGTYDVHLAVGTSGSSDTTVLRNAITVLPSECDVVDPQPGGCVDLSSPADFASLGTFLGTTNNFTFTAWVKPNGIQPNFSAILCTDELDGYKGEIGMQIVADSNEVGYLWKDGRWWWRSGLRLKPDQWNHVALMVDEKGASVMVNGVLARDEVNLPAQDLGKLAFTLGTYHYWDNRNLNAQIDEVRLYYVTLAPNEVHRRMHHPENADTNELMGWYQFNESGGGEMFDAIGKQHGSVSGGARRVASTIPYGPGSTWMSQPPVTSIPLYDALGIDAQFEQTVPDSVAMLTRINRVAPGAVMQTVLQPVYFCLQSTQVQPLTTSFLGFQMEGLIGWADALSRRYHLWQRPAYNMDAAWTEVQGASQYNGVSRRLAFRATEPLDARALFCITVEGGPVGVEVPAAPAQLSCHPQPASDVLTVTSSEPLGALILADVMGRVLWSRLEEGNRCSIDVRWLPVGAYALLHAGGALPVRIVR